VFLRELLVPEYTGNIAPGIAPFVQQMNNSSDRTAAIATPGVIDRFLAYYARSRFRGFPHLWNLLGRDSGDTVRCLTSYGTAFELDPWSYIDRTVLQEGFYESEVLDAIVSELSSNGVLWDIGANLGLHGLTAKKMVPTAQVVCFDPSPAIVGKLWRNRLLNGLEVAIIAAGLSDKNGFQTLYVAPAGNPGMSTLNPWSDSMHESLALVATVRGDDLIEAGQVPSPTVIKVDVEGHEPAVLRGLRHALALTCRAVIFEDSPESETETKAMLTAAGFRFESLARHEATHHGLVNFLARRG
jgi:FkbM family methyltransferase